MIQEQARVRNHKLLTIVSWMEESARVCLFSGERAGGPGQITPACARSVPPHCTLARSCAGG